MNGKPQSTLQQFIRYIGIGGIAFVFDFATLTLVVGTLHGSVLAGATAGFLVGATVNYLLCLYFVFAARSLKQHRMAEFWIFVLIGVIGLGINDAIIYGCHKWMPGLDYRAGKFVAAAVVLVFNFTFRKIILFNNRRSDSAVQVEVAAPLQQLP
ncbi:GtrA family protein [Silvimonas iriomotensis]|uniref:GtrA/DPMS transmembrane domain-containing protein n=1 Tax=Silvimonas iriomotensis TaxID=449662 RepID=A0ABQ2PEN9_9NEIS|nr:GtrA family protein [Silvimonas iriomotensis]GGP23731.1 hypothetical protein GCM10010970_37310 [Silvimonas iriomotensis]